MRIIGITGSIACGKSTVSRFLSGQGYPVIDGDLISRNLTAPGGRAVRAVRAAFGSSYIDPDGSMNRREMGKLVFSDPQAREQLDRVMEPYLRSETESEIERARTSGAALCFLDMPLLFEKGYDRYCDTVWCVWIPEDLQLERLMKRDGYSQLDAMNRIRSVMSSDQKADLSSVVIDNSGSVENTLRQVSELVGREVLRTENTPRRRRSGSTAQGPAVASAQAAGTAPVPAAQPQPEQIDRPEASRKSASRRRSSWVMPVPVRNTLIILCVLLAVSFTAQMLMKAYLSRQAAAHQAEQNAIDERYPLQYRSSITAIAGEYNLSPALIAAIIMNESSFRPSARSAVGARGLMQVMPETGEWIAHKLQYDNYYSDLLDDPETNIRFGCWYISYLSSLFNGDPLCVVCAYHAGQGEISAWLSNPLYSTDGKKLNMENLPDGPTKTYAGRVTRDYGIYQVKHFQENGSDSAGDPADSSVQ